MDKFQVVLSNLIYRERKKNKIEKNYIFFGGILNIELYYSV